MLHYRSKAPLLSNSKHQPYIHQTGNSPYTGCKQQPLLSEINKVWQILLVQWSPSQQPPLLPGWSDHIREVVSYQGYTYTKMWDLVPDFGRLITGGIDWQKGGGSHNRWSHCIYCNSGYVHLSYSVWSKIALFLSAVSLYRVSITRQPLVYRTTVGSSKSMNEKSVYRFWLHISIVMSVNHHQPITKHEERTV